MGHTSAAVKVALWLHVMEHPLVVAQTGPHITATQMEFRGYCMGNKNNARRSIILSNTEKVTAIKFKWVSGALACRDGSTDIPPVPHFGRWGCYDPVNDISKMTLKLTTQDNVEILPITQGGLNNVAAFVPASQAMTNWPTPPVTAETASELVWALIDPIPMPLGEYRIWDAEDLADANEADNSGHVCYDIFLSCQNGCTAPAPGATTGGDPVTFYGNVRREFLLEPGQLTELLDAKDVKIFGSVFASENKEQWFERFLVTTLEDLTVLDIRIKKRIDLFNRSAASAGALGTLDVEVAGGHGTVPLLAMPRENLDLHGIPVGFWKMRKGWLPVLETRIGREHRECAELNVPALHLAICSSAATEYFGWQRELSIRYAHLDLIISRIRDPKALTGPLPELWGLHPLSEATRAMLVTGEAEEPPPNQTIEAWVGGWDGVGPKKVNGVV